MFKLGIVSEQFKYVFTGKYSGSRDDPQILARMKDAGALFVLEFPSKCLFFTDYFIVEVSGYDGAYGDFCAHQNKVELLPYSEISSVSFHYKESDFYAPSHTETVDVTPKGRGNLAKGALVGGILAGTTGAVVGYAVAQEAKTKRDIKEFHYEGGRIHRRDFRVSIYDKEGKGARQGYSYANDYNYEKGGNYELGRRWTLAGNKALCDIGYDLNSLLDGSIEMQYQEKVNRLLRQGKENEKRLGRLIEYKEKYGEKLNRKEEVEFGRSETQKEIDSMAQKLCEYEKILGSREKSGLFTKINDFLTYGKSLEQKFAECREKKEQLNDTLNKLLRELDEINNIPRLQDYLGVSTNIGEEK
jgi:hypothetical protein